MRARKLLQSSIAAFVLSLSFVVGFLPPIASRAATYTACDAASGATPTIQQANDLLANRYTFPPHPTVTLPSNPRWNEDPLHDMNWQLRYHQMHWTEPLWFAWVSTGDARYRNRYLFLLQDWYQDNPYAHPPSTMSWQQHATAIRASVYACALQRISPRPSWLVSAATAHGQVLQKDDFYLHTGNRALDQDLGLLDIGCQLPRGSWQALAAGRIGTWVDANIDTQGVSAEQSDGYNFYVFKRLDLTLQQMIACGLTPSADLTSRHDNMLRFITDAVLPFDHYAMIGDTGDGKLPYYRGTWLEYMYNNGIAGPKPDWLYGAYGRGYEFFHSGWGEQRSLKDETHIAVRFGEARQNHGHLDAAAVTLTDYGDRLLLDSGGPYLYGSTDPYSKYFVSERAHNTISVDGIPMRDTGWTYLKGQAHTADFDFVSLLHYKMRGVEHRRRVFYDRRLDVLLIEDQLLATGPVAFRQNWHFHHSAAPLVSGRSIVYTRRTTGPNVRLTQLTGDNRPSLRTGSTNPVQGWLTYTYGKLTKAPAVDFAQIGRHARFVTLIVPSRSGPARAISVTGFALAKYGFDVNLRIGLVTDRISVRDTTAGFQAL